MMLNLMVKRTTIAGLSLVAFLAILLGTGLWTGKIHIRPSNAFGVSNFGDQQGGSSAAKGVSTKTTIIDPCVFQGCIHHDPEYQEYDPEGISYCASGQDNPPCSVNNPKAWSPPEPGFSICKAQAGPCHNCQIYISSDLKFLATVGGATGRWLGGPGDNANCKVSYVLVVKTTDYNEQNKRFACDENVAQRIPCAKEPCYDFTSPR